LRKNVTELQAALRKVSASASASAQTIDTAETTTSMAAASASLLPSSLAVDVRRLERLLDDARREVSLVFVLFCVLFFCFVVFCFVLYVTARTTHLISYFVISAFRQHSL
jgi:drug/metabolite transporter (DMT)-like permease